MLCTQRVRCRFEDWLERVESATVALCTRRWVVRDLEAELTTFELFKTPFDELIELIVLARSRSIGLPELQLPNPSAPNS